MKAIFNWVEWREWLLAKAGGSGWVMGSGVGAGDLSAVEFTGRSEQPICGLRQSVFPHSPTLQSF